MAFHAFSISDQEYIFQFSFLGRCKTFRCESDQDCKDAVADTMLMNTKMKCVFKESEREVVTN